jgi:hypothetical protein
MFSAIIQKTRLIRHLLPLACVLVAYVMAPAQSLAQPAYDIDAVSRAAVQVRVDDGTGSGTLIMVDNEALVLTNRHVIEGFNNAVIAVLVDVNAPAEPMFEATLVGFSDTYDFAVLRLNTDLQGNPVSVNQLKNGDFGFTVPEIPLHTRDNKEGDVRRGDNIAIFGYPGIGDNELVYTTGIISSVQFGEYQGERMPMWYRTTAEMSPGNSGGMALNARGEFVGIPTSVRTEYETGGRLGTLLAVPLVMAILENEDALLTSWDGYVGDNALDFSQDPFYGSVTMDSSNASETIYTEIVSGGPVEVRYLGDECRGFASPSPDLRLQLDEAVGDLSVIFFAMEDADATLIVNTPDGQWHCNDDMEDGSIDPGLWFPEASVGQYDIWVGSYNNDEWIDGVLTIYNGTLDASTDVDDDFSDSSAGLDWSNDPFAGSVSLQAGFVPDPHVIDVVSGGSVDVAAGDYGAACTGYAATAPDLRLNWSGDSSTLRIMFEADDSSEDTTLIINTADGRWLCDDDGRSGLDPLVEISSPSAGQYDIWVGSYQAGEYISGKIKITELSDTL